MKIGLLETGKVNPDLVPDHGTYLQMFRDFLAAGDPDLVLEAWDVVERGEIPDSPRAADGWLITGSKFGVYDPEPWIAPLKAFLAKAHAARVPIVGICFGHQILAEALGGRVEKSDRGWGCGVHRYRLVADASVMLPDAQDSLAVNAMHQDQVVAPPESARVIMQTPFCPYAGLAYGDTAISMQPHPEFDTAYERDLITLRSGVPGIPADVAEAGVKSLAEPTDNAAVAAWVARFFRAKQPA